MTLPDTGDALEPGLDVGFPNIDGGCRHRLPGRQSPLDFGILAESPERHPAHFVFALDNAAVGSSFESELRIVDV